MPVRTLLALLLAACATAAAAQPYPSRPVRIVIGFPPGGGIDTVARLLGPKIAESWGQPIVVENRPGGGGVLGTEVVAKSAPDGHTLFFGTMGNLAVNPAFLPNLPFDMDRDLAPVTQVVSASFMLYVHPAVPAQNVEQFVAHAKAHPGKLNFCSSGNGGAPHLAAELFSAMAGIKTVHIPYKGSAPCIADLIGAQVQFTFEAVTIGLPHVKSGKLRTLGVTAAKRLPMLADVPAVAETLPGFDVDNWYGMAVPAGTPREAIVRIRDEVAKAMAIPEIRDRLLSLGQVPVASSPDDFSRFIRAEREKWLKVIRQAGIQPG
jgi:tripartite-type tricarboxylate transporter receptor subunit TctC